MSNLYNPNPISSFLCGNEEQKFRLYVGSDLNEGHPRCHTLQTLSSLADHSASNASISTTLYIATFYRRHMLLAKEDMFTDIAHLPINMNMN